MELILINLDKLSEPVKKLALPYCQKMLQLHKENLKAIFIYGSGVGEDFIPGKSNLNISFIFNEIDPPDLKKSLKLVTEGRKKKIAAPLILTLKHIKTSIDVFPVEFRELKANHILLYGEDILEGLTINPQNIRLQCEQQIKGGLIRLYQSYLEIGMKEKEIKNLIIASITNLNSIFRNLLYLKGKEPPIKKREIVVQLSKEFELNTEIFTKILDLKEGKKITDSTEKLFGDYIEEIEKLGIAVDKMEEKGGS